MELMPVKPERKAELEDYARRHGTDAVAALDDVLAPYLEWEREEFADALQAIREGHKDVKAGRSEPMEDVFEELRLKHGISR